MDLTMITARTGRLIKRTDEPVRSLGYHSVPYSWSTSCTTVLHLVLDKVLLDCLSYKLTVLISPRFWLGVHPINGNQSSLYKVPQCKITACNRWNSMINLGTWLALSANLVQWQLMWHMFKPLGWAATFMWRWSDNEWDSEMWFATFVGALV